MLINSLPTSLPNTSRHPYPVVVEPKKQAPTAKRIAVFVITEKRRQKDIPLGNIDPRKRLCSLNLTGNFSYSRLLSAIRACFHFFIERNRGFLLHASCGTVQGRTYIFTGKAGSGKSTALQNCHPEKIIAEDFLAIRITEKQPAAFSIPFRREKSALARPRAIIFPKKFPGPTHLVKETNAQAVSEITANALFCSPHCLSLVQPVLKSISKFCVLVPGYSLYFVRKANLREILP